MFVDSLRMLNHDDSKLKNIPSAHFLRQNVVHVQINAYNKKKFQMFPLNMALTSLVK